MTNTAKISADAMASATQAYQARLTTQASSGKKNVTPKARPIVKAYRSDRPYSSTTSSAGATIASGHALTGANARDRSRPLASASGSAARIRSLSSGGSGGSAAGAAVAAGLRVAAGARAASASDGSASDCPMITLSRVDRNGSGREVGNFAIYREHGNPLR